MFPIIWHRGKQKPYPPGRKLQRAPRPKPLPLTKPRRVPKELLDTASAVELEQAIDPYLYYDIDTDEEELIILGVL